MPIRFTSPSLGGQQEDTYLAPHHWQLGVAYRRLTADQWIVGKEVREDKAPFGQPLFLNINSVDVTVGYGVSDRLSFSATLPFSHGTHSRFYADGARHQVSASGLGDVNVTGTYWLRNPRDRADRNVAIGVGVKAPTGRNDARDAYFGGSGTTDFTVDQSIQLGDGGWGVMLQAQGFTRLSRRTYGYATGSYLVSPRNQTDVRQAPSGAYSAVRVSVPDVFSAGAGAAYALGHGLSVSLGGRVDGIPMRDLVGSSDGFRRPATIGYLEPGLTIMRGSGSVVLNVPVKAYSNFRPSEVDRQFGAAGGGDLARYLLLASYQVRF